MEQGVSAIRPDTRVYKEECVHCFQNTRSPGGINVCLKCFTAGCDAHAKHHAASFGGHTLSLNIRQIREVVEGDGESPPQKLTKIAIGVEGGADAGQSANWRTETHVRVWPSGEVMQNVPGGVSAVVAQLLSATDMGAKEDSKAWEKKLHPCEHTLTLQQEASKSSVGSTCSMCELKKPLWLCLTCGHLGCGRPLPPPMQHEGGRGHAMEHRRNNPSHVLVAKMGTITPDGKGDVYCYGCDEDVVDEDLAVHLKQFGINVSTAVKTEMSMLELELERNKLLDLLSTEDGTKLVPCYGPGFTGLRNIGNTCYMNSVLQTFFALPEVRKQYYEEVWRNHNPNCREGEPARCWLCQMGKLANGLYSGDYSKAPVEEKGPAAGVAPRMWKQLVTRDSLFQGVDQQDAYEFFQFLLKKIAENQRRVGGNDASKAFTFDMCQKVQCLNCMGYRMVTEKGTTELSLGIPLEEVQPPLAASPEGESAADRMKRQYASQVSFDACVRQWNSSEVIEGFNCPKCKSATAAAKTQFVATFPQVLMVQLRRFTIEKWVPQKLSVRLSGLENVQGAPFKVDLSSLQVPAADPTETLLPEDGGNAAGPAVDANIVAQLEAMGFPRVRCERAAFETKNAGAEEAMNYLFAHMDDPALDVPLPKAAPSGGAKKDSKWTPEQVEQLTSMGFTDAKAKHALRECDGNVERAIDWLFSHADDVIEEVADHAPAAPAGVVAEEPRGPKVYELFGFILHKGNQIQSGHYVAYIWSEKQNNWIVYDDERVSISEKPPIDQAYLLFFKRR